MRCAIVDIGSNTVKMNIYDVTPPDKIRLIMSQSTTLGLIGYIRSGSLTGEGIDKLGKTIARYVRLASDVAADELHCIATASLRSVNNAIAVLEKIKSRTGCKPELISGDCEALLSLEGIKTALGDVSAGIMADMGGGSTEIVGFIDGNAVDTVSVPIGCLSLFERFISGVMPKKSELRRLCEFVDAQLSESDWLTGYGQTLYLVGGTSRLIARMYRRLFGKSAMQIETYEGSDGKAYTFTSEGLTALYRRFADPSTEEIRALIRLAPDRIHTFVPGLAATSRLARACSAERITVVFSGIREGYVKSRLLGQKS